MSSSAAIGSGMNQSIESRLSTVPASRASRAPAPSALRAESSLLLGELPTDGTAMSRKTPASAPTAVKLAPTDRVRLFDVERDLAKRIGFSINRYEKYAG